MVVQNVIVLYWGGVHDIVMYGEGLNGMHNVIVLYWCGTCNCALYSVVWCGIGLERIPDYPVNYLLH